MIISLSLETEFCECWFGTIGLTKRRQESNGLTANLGLFDLVLGRREHATLEPNFKEAAACDKSAKTQEGVLYTQSRQPSLTKLSLEIQCKINGTFLKQNPWF